MASRTNISSSPGPLCFLLLLPPLTLTQPSLMQAPQTVKCAMKTESNTMLGFLGRRVLWPLGILIFISALFTLQRRHFTDGPSIAHSRSSDKSDSLKHVFNSTLGFQDILVVGMPSRTDRRDGMILGAALSGLKINFIDGVKGEDVYEKAIPVPEDRNNHLKGPGLGSWRAHMNAIHDVVRRNLSSALIMEDDVDWDVRIREQLHDFAASSRALTQPLRHQPGQYADPTYPNPVEGSPKKVPDMNFHSLPDTVQPLMSPYGDNWDVLWLGHCGMHFVFEHSNLIAKGRVVKENDVSVPPKKNLWSINKPFSLVEEYPAHTRVVHHAQEGVCSLAYAVSQRGAQKMLREIALKPATDAFDILLRFYCEGTHDRTKQECLSVNPSLFSHHRPVGPIGASSDIGDHGEGYRHEASTDMVRFSVRLNAEVILNGSTNYIDQFPDSAE
ncbi:glycosyl transferase family 25 protein [Metarhizium robertsii]|uniref:Glycosyltransferase family 25 protein n=2 Tax=Metarhizium robertsii TaxID=568076 RepID=E9F333_METRA|nr:glycosyltransferase family 25 protein [Metarhizium robertsii ARSEF 23]EFY97899.1 glycosyltransferase family 25 protein [Metarhizium robertsii ARSEF 23]EXV00478.1 glycosyl transferase family 25 protein [Metarhizium robertsii]